MNNFDLITQHEITSLVTRYDGVDNNRHAIAVKQHPDKDIFAVVLDGKTVEENATKRSKNTIIANYIINNKTPEYMDGVYNNNN